MPQLYFGNLTLVQYICDVNQLIISYEIQLRVLVKYQVGASKGKGLIPQGYLVSLFSAQQD
jgi:hypothetical protein